MSNKDNESLISLITPKEIELVIKNLPSSKSPGPDGITYEFYKKFRKLVIPRLTDLFNDILNLTKPIPESWKESLIILIPKKEKEKHLVQNWRPIALINSDCKIFMKIVANRLNSRPLSRIIGNHQNGFISKRSIVDNILDIESILHSETSESSALLFLDQQKAFDRVEHSYMLDTLKAFNFSPTFISIIQDLYQNQFASIDFKQSTTRRFRLERGVRQGDPLSPLLYAISFEPFLRRINNSLTGIGIDNHFLKCRAYADDTVICLHKSDWSLCKGIISEYEQLSGARVNSSKSKLIFLNKPNATTLRNALPFEPIDDNETITFLGIPIRNRKFDNKTFWNTILSKLSRLVESYSERNLSIRGRVLVAKSLVLSRIWYFTPVLSIPYRIKNDINTLIRNFIRNSAFLPSYKHLMSHINEGGINAPCLKSSITAINGKFFLKLIASSTFWATVARGKIIKKSSTSRKELDIQTIISNPSFRGKWTRRWIPWWRAWKLLEGSYEDSFTSPFINLRDISIASKVATEYSVKLGYNYVIDYSPISKTKKKLFHALWCIDRTPRQRELLWKMKINALPTGYRKRRFSLEACFYCDKIEFSTKHIQWNCWFSKRIMEAMGWSFLWSTSNLKTKTRLLFILTLQSLFITNWYRFTFEDTLPKEIITTLAIKTIKKQLIDCSKIAKNPKLAKLLQ